MKMAELAKKTTVDMQEEIKIKRMESMEKLTTK